MNFITATLLIFSVIEMGVNSVSGDVGPIVLTTEGHIRGEILTTVEQNTRYASFRGIPFAEPPLGYLRFKPPVPKAPWSGILQTTVDGSNCVQDDYIFGGITGSEDCLYLNVYTPKTNFFRHSNKNLRPVMVWIFGGKFLRGHANSSIYGPDFIVEQGVILVTFNYRLGPLGFLNLNHPDATGNAALKDQNAALKWVNRNIWRFGGDKDCVTIFGQSAGASSVDFHVLSEMSKGLFHKSISMSGSPLVEWSFQKPYEAMKNAFKLGRRLGIKTTNTDKLLQTLYHAPARDLMRIAEEISTVYPSFRPTIESTNVAPNEEKFLTECPKSKYNSGRFFKGPHIMGIMKHECVGFAEKASEFLKKLESNKNACMIGYWEKLLQRVGNSIRNAFTKVARKTINSIYNVATKFFFVFGIDKKQRMMIRNNDMNSIYYYQISVDPEFSLHKHLWNVTNIHGAAHGDEILYLFHTKLMDVPMDKQNLLTRTRNRVVKLWTNFAKFGNPSPSTVVDSTLNVTWPNSGPHGAYLDIGADLNVVDDRLKMFTKFWNKLFNLIKDDTC